MLSTGKPSFYAKPRALTSTSGSVSTCREMVPYLGNIPVESTGKVGAVGSRMGQGLFPEPFFVQECDLPPEVRQWLDHISITMTTNMVMSAMANAVILSHWHIETEGPLEKLVGKEETDTIHVLPNLRRMFTGGEIIKNDMLPRNSVDQLSTDQVQGQDQCQGQREQLQELVEQEQEDNVSINIPPNLRRMFYGGGMIANNSPPRNSGNQLPTNQGRGQQQQLQVQWRKLSLNPATWRPRCQVSNNTFAVDRVYHIQIPSIQDGKNFQCETCFQRFLTQRALVKHDRSHDCYQCGVCGKIFVYRNSIRAHERVHTGERPFRCANCPKAYTQLCSLTYHLRRHPFHLRLRENFPLGDFQLGGNNYFRTRDDSCSWRKLIEAKSRRQNVRSMFASSKMGS